jgi:heme exporter protein D
MMPELGQYAGTVLGAYGVTLALLALLIALTLHRAAKVRRELAKIEARDPRRTDGRP